MNHAMIFTRMRTSVAVGFAVVLGASSAMAAVNIVDYTAYPPFLNKTVAPNVLFIIDLGNYQLPAAYGNYPISAKAGTVTDNNGTLGWIASNVTLEAGVTNFNLAAANSSGVLVKTCANSAVDCNNSVVTTPTDQFDSTKSYYGLFDTLRCYVQGGSGSHFTYGSTKVNVSDTCGSSYWDGNFLNWLAMRKKDVAIQALMGGKALPAPSNNTGWADKLEGEDKTGENGSTKNCYQGGSIKNSDSCWRYVKFVPNTTLSGRVPSTGTPFSTTDLAGAAVNPPGRFFGIGDGKIYVNADNDGDFFDASSSSAQFMIGVDLTTEPDVPAGKGSKTTCVPGAPWDNSDPDYAGNNFCYKKERSMGLFQHLRLDAMHVAVMFADATGGKAGNIVYQFDDTYNASSINNIRNQAVKTKAPLAEATYEALCVYRNSQGPCYNNSPADFTATPDTRYDPFWFCDKDSTGNCTTPVTGKTVSCCKSYILMISPGQPVSDDNDPDKLAQFGTFASLYGSNIGVTTSRLDDVAYYGKQHDIRDQTSGSGAVAGKQNVTFYAVNAMGGAAGAQLLASAAKFGGFKDRNNDNAVNLTGTQDCTYPSGSSLGSGTVTNGSNPEWDLDKDCIPDTYFSAEEGEDLEGEVKKAIAAILTEAASGTSISVLSSSSTGDGAMYQAFFFPLTYEGLNEITWTGYTQGLFIDSFGNIREDTDGDHRLVYQHDYIIQTRLDTTTGEVYIDRYADSNGDGISDSATATDTILLRDTHSLWEAGKQLANTASSTRNLITWVDSDNDGVIDSGEVVPFATTNSTLLKPYLRADTTGIYTADNIINFVRGDQISGMRDRQLTVGGSLQVWKLGDVLHATPTVVGAPKERFDVVYGDASYTAFYQKYRDRRQVAYVGGNDGMLHAFNAGFYHRGDDATTSDVEHGYFTTNPTGNAASDAPLGSEMWGFIPYQLLPQLKFLTQKDYTHVYYVDLKPKITEARIFTPDADHPNGWGIILIGGFRMGGSCGACTAASGTSKGAPPLSVTADFDNNAGTPDTTRTFYSAYFVLDITNPEADPKILWVFSDSGMGLTTSYPAVVRASPTGDNKTLDTNAKFFAMFGSGMTGYDGSSAQTSKIYAVDLKTGPKDNTGANIFTTFPVSDPQSFMGDVIAGDVDLDFRADAVYVGNSIDITGPPDWIGKMYRLTTKGCVTAGSTCSTSTWGVSSGGNRVPTELLNAFPSSLASHPGPITAGATLTVDDANNTWVYFGSGRFYTSNDKTNVDTQYFFGVKDPVMHGGCTESTATNCAQPDLVDVSSAQVCTVCASGTSQVSGVTGVTTFDTGSGTTSLVGLVASKNGWFTTLPTSGERALATPVLLGGVVFFPTFVPVNDICKATGDGFVYALNYRTGSASPTPMIGTTTAGGSTVVNRDVSLGNVGVVSQLALHIGGGNGSSGATGGGSGGGCGGGTSLIAQTSGATTFNMCSSLSGVRSHYVSWNNPRE